MNPTPPTALERSLAPRGTAWYYATMHLDAGVRLNVLTLQAWWRAVSAIPREVSDDGVAAAKLAWWRAQLGQSVEGTAEHPLLRALQPALQRQALALPLLLRALDHVDASLRQSRWLDAGAVDAHLDAGPGSIARATALLSGTPAVPDPAWADAMGVALARVAMLRDLGRSLRLGIVPLPVNLLAAHDVKARTLLERERSAAVRALLGTVATQALQALDAARAVRPSAVGAVRPAVRIAAALERIARAQLRELQQAEDALLEQRITLPPLRLLWEAWRGQRSA